MNTNGNGRFAGKVVFVTGAGNGIGRATAIAFAREGASVVAADLSEEHSRDTVQSIEQLRGNVMAVSCDVTSSDQIGAALQRAVDAFGRIDIAFNNAGVEQRNARVADITESEWERVVATNLRVDVFGDLNGKIVDNAANSGALGVAGVPAPSIGHGLPVLLTLGAVLFGAHLLQRANKRRSLEA